MKNSTIKIQLLTSLIVCFTGCVGAAVEGGHIAADNVVRLQNKEAAEKGDKVAQFKVGESYCCSTDKSGAAYDTTTSVQWLCLSAKQGYGPAMYKLGKIYTGDVVDGLRLIRRVATGINETATGSTVSLPVGSAWLALAKSSGVQEASDRLEKARSAMSPADLRQSEKLGSLGLRIPCEMHEVFPG